MDGFRAGLVLSLSLRALSAWGQTASPEPATEVRFEEFFGPVGARGLEYSAKLRSLAGHRVSIRGYGVAREDSPPGTFLLAPFPAQLHETEYGLADDLPAATVFVEAPAWRGRAIPHRPGLLTVTGVLEIGNREEPDGRISSVRLVLDDGPDSDPVHDPNEINEKETLP